MLDLLVHVLFKAHESYRALRVCGIGLKQAGDNAHVLGAGEVRVRGRRLDERTNTGENLAAGPARHRPAQHGDLAGGRGGQAEQHLHRGRLARTVRPQQAMYRALGHFEIELIDDCVFPVGLSQTLR